MQYFFGGGRKKEVEPHLKIQQLEGPEHSH
jgi:hypothetical protein